MSSSSCSAFFTEVSIKSSSIVESVSYTPLENAISTIPEESKIYIAHVFINKRVVVYLNLYKLTQQNISLCWSFISEHLSVLHIFFFASKALTTLLSRG